MYDVCLERPKINEKEAGDGPFLKKTCTGFTGTSYRWSEEDEEKPRRDGDLREVAQHDGLAKPDEGREGLVELGQLTDENVRGLGIFWNLELQ